MKLYNAHFLCGKLTGIVLAPVTLVSALPLTYQTSAKSLHLPHELDAQANNCAHESPWLLERLQTT